jgi:hypothetical protein
MMKLKRLLLQLFVENRSKNCEENINSIAIETAEELSRTSVL